MGTFNKLKRSRKSSHLDEKIEFLNKELEKTGVILETPANSTANIYNTIEFTPGIPEVQEYVPDSTGFIAGTSTQNANGGDESDSDTWENGWNNLDDMKNPNNLNGVTNRDIVYTPDLSGWNGTGVSYNNTGSGGYVSIAYYTIWTGIGGGKAIGSIDSTNHFIQMLVPDNVFSSYAPPSGSNIPNYYSAYNSDELQAAQNASITYSEYRYDISAWKSRKVWVDFNDSNTNGGPTYAEYTGAKKMHNGKAWRLKTISVLGARASYTSVTGTPDSRTTIFRTGLDDGEYYPGPTSGFMDFLRGALGVSKQALDWLLDNASPTGIIGNNFDAALDLGADILRAISDITSGDIESAAAELLAGAGIEGGKAAELLGDLAGGISNLAKEGQVLLDYLAGNLEDGSINNDYLGQEVVNDIIANADGGLANGKFVAKDKIIGTGGTPTVDNSSGQGDDRIATFHFEYDFETNMEQIMSDPDEWDVNSSTFKAINMVGRWAVGGKYGLDSGDLPFAGYAIWIQKLRDAGGAQGTTGHGITMSLADIKKLNEPLYNTLKQMYPDNSASDDDDWYSKTNFNPDGSHKQTKYSWQESYLVEGWESPKHTYVDKNQQKRWFKEKDVAPIYPKKAPPKLVRGYHPDMLPKLDTPIPQIKVSKKDLIRAHKLTKVEAQEWVDKIERLNDYIARNPDRLAYVRERYPASDPHLAALNYKMDMQLAASDEYIEKQFPENIRLYNKVLAATKKSIKLSDPKTFKSEKGVFTTFNKLARVQHVDTVYQPKERTLKLKKRTKNSVNRFLFKPKEKTKDDILKDKLAVLDKEIQKTMPDT